MYRTVSQLFLNSEIGRFEVREPLWIQELELLADQDPTLCVFQLLESTMFPELQINLSPSSERVE